MVIVCRYCTEHNEVMQSDITILQLLLVQRLCPLKQVIHLQWGKGSWEFDDVIVLWRRHWKEWGHKYYFT